MKPPRTLFSLGRPGAKRDEAPADADEPVEEYEEGFQEGELQFACGACGALLPTGAAFCGECGTPIDTSVWDDLDEDLLEGDELVAEAQPAADAGLVDPALATDTSATVNMSAAAMAAAVAEARGDAPAPEATVEVPAEAAPPVEVPEPEAAPAAEVPAGATVELTDVPAPVAEVPAEGSVTQVIAAPPAEPEAHPDATEVAAAVGPAAVLYADPSMAEPLAPTPAQPWGVSDPSMGHVDTGTERDTLAPSTSGAETVAVDAAALAGAGAVGAVLGADAAAAEMPTEVQPVVGAPVEPEPPVVPSALVGTTAASMPYGSGPVQSSEKSKVPMFAGIGAGVVVLIVIIVVLMSGGSKDAPSDVATVSTTATTAKATTTVADKSTTTASTKGSDTTATTATTAPTTTESTAPVTETTAPDTTATTAATTVTTLPVTTQQTTTNPTFKTTTTKGSPNLSITPTSFDRLDPNSSVNITISNTGSGPGAYLCNSSADLTVTPANGTINAGSSQLVSLKDNLGVGRTKQLTCTLPSGSVTITLKYT